MKEGRQVGKSIDGKRRIFKDGRHNSSFMYQYRQCSADRKVTRQDAEQMMGTGPHVQGRDWPGLTRHRSQPSSRVQVQGGGSVGDRGGAGPPLVTPMFCVKGKLSSHKGEGGEHALELRSLFHLAQAQERA